MLPFILHSKSSKVLEKIILEKCGLNTKLVAEALRLAVQLDLHVEVFQERIHAEEDSVREALLLLLKTSNDNDELWKILNELNFDWEKSEILGKGVLHWIVELDKTDLLSFIFEAMNSADFKRCYANDHPPSSALKVMKTILGYSQNAFSYSDSEGNTPFHYVKSGEMIRFFDSYPDLNWYLTRNINGFTPFTKLMAEERFDLAESIKTTDRRFKQMKYNSWNSLKVTFGPTRFFKVRRNNILGSFKDIYKTSFAHGIPRFEIHFKGEYANDCGGPTREFFTLGMKEIFEGTESIKPYFEIVDEESLLYAPSHNYDPKVFRDIGAFVAFAFFNGISTGVEMIPMLFQAIYGFDNWTQEMFEHQHPAIYKSLKSMLDPDANLDAFGVYFDEEAGIKVDSSNVQEYCYRMMKSKLQFLHQERIEEFAEGFNAFLKGTVQLHLTPRELNILLKGENRITASEFLENIKFAPDSSGRTLWHFKEVIGAFNSEQIMRLIHFTTGLDRLPFGGMASMNPSITVAFIDDDDNGKLPSAGTCNGYLFIPNYGSKRQLRKKLLYAINEGLQFAYETETVSSMDYEQESYWPDAYYGSDEENDDEAEIDEDAEGYGSDDYSAQNVDEEEEDDDDENLDEYFTGYEESMEEKEDF